MYILPLEKRKQIIHQLVEGASMRATSRLTDTSIMTVMKVLAETGKACIKFHNELIILNTVVMINDNELKNFKWNDVAVIKINDRDAIIIILMFDTYEEGNRFIEKILSKYPFSFKAKTHPTNQEFAFEIEFKDSALLMVWFSGLTGFSYPPFTWLNQGSPTFITNGVWIQNKRQQGKEYRYNPDVLPLNPKLESSSLEEEIQRAFAKAMRIEF